jgi:hypothetical protein
VSLGPVDAVVELRPSIRKVPISDAHIRQSVAMSRRVGPWLAGAGVALVVQMICLLVLEAILSDSAGDEIILMPAASILGVVIVGAVVLIATGLPPPQIGFLGGGMSANLLWLLAGFNAWGLAVVAVVSVVAVLALARRIDWATVSA